MKFVVALIATAIAFIGLDAIWLSQIARRFYPPIIGELLASTVRLGPAIAFYLIYITGIVLLAVLPAERGGAKRSLFRGAVLGLVAYATYDLTNQATLRVWSMAITLADLAWGAIITAIAATIGHLFASRIPERFGSAR